MFDLVIKYIKVKLILALLLVFLTHSGSYAQNYNYNEYSAGGSFSITRAHVDVAKQINRRAFSANINYHFSPYLTFGAELQSGNLSGGDHVYDPHLREFSNNYTSFTLIGDVQVGEISNYMDSWFLYALKDFYAGTGIGVINNKMSFIQRVKPDGSAYVFPGKDKSLNLLVPIRLGYEFKIYNGYGEPQFRLNLGYQLGLTFGEGLDGYNDPPSKFKNNSLDMYSQIMVGVKIGFGNITSYTKPIR
jgi:hypothetical protein